MGHASKSTRYGRTVAERLWEKVEKRGPDECWLWTAVRNACGYGQLRVGGQMLLAHRVSYELCHGNIPEGLCVLHSCDNPPCVNPAHLRCGTHRQNMADMRDRGRSKGLHARGEKHLDAKITGGQVLEIRAIYAGGGVSLRALARRFGLHATTICRIVNRRTWAHIA